MRTCLFCNSTEVTKEHVWPEWISRLFHPRPQRGRYRFVRESAEDPQERYESSINKTIKLVCKTCNEGWMSEVESVAKPILSRVIMGHGRSLSTDDQVVLAAWISLRAMIIDQTASKSAERYYTRDERERFAAIDTDGGLEPPDGSHIWLFHFRSTQNRMASYTVQNLYRVNPADRTVNHAQVVTATVGCFGFQVLAGRWFANIEIDRNSAALVNWRMATQLLWPSSGTTFRYPLITHLRDDALQSFRERWRDGVKLIIRAPRQFSGRHFSSDG